MNKLKDEKNSGVLFLLVLGVALLFAVYYYVVLPKKEDVSVIQNSITTLQSEVFKIQEQITIAKSDASDIASDTFALRKKLPQDRAMTELLLSIEEIEFVSESRILSLDFNNYDTTVVDSTLQEPSQLEAMVEGMETGEVDTAPVSEIAQEALPVDLKMLTFSVNVESPNAEKFTLFLKELESLERVMRVDTIDYSLPGEENEFAEDKSAIVLATIQVTTFYYEGE